MTQNDRLMKVDAFVDGELDLRAQLDMEERLRDDPVLREQIGHLRQMRAAVRERATYHAAPDALRERLAAMQPGAIPPDAARDAPRPQRAVARATPWLGWRPLAASMAAAAALAVAVNLAWLQSSREDQVAGEVVASHVRSSLGEHLVDVASSDHHTVKPFLSARLGFSPPVQELDLPGSTFVGGRVDYLEGRPVAAIVFRQGQHIVNSFVWPSKGGDRQPSFSSQQGFLTAHWASSGMTHWVVSDVNAEEFRNVVRAIRTAESGR